LLIRQARHVHVGCCVIADLLRCHPQAFLQIPSVSYHKRPPLRLVQHVAQYFFEAVEALEVFCFSELIAQFSKGFRRPING
jgi:hypothetical protein